MDEGELEETEPPMHIIESTLTHLMMELSTPIHA